MFYTSIVLCVDDYLELHSKKKTFGLQNKSLTYAFPQFNK